MTTTAPVLAGDPAELPDSRRRPLGVIWSVIKSQPQAAVGTAILVLVVLIAFLAPVIAPYGEREVVGEPFEAPSRSHWLGLDDGGVDMVTLLIWGARVSLIVGFAAALVAMLIGGAFGILAGYFGGKLDISPHAIDRLLPGHSGHRAHDRDRSHLGPKPPEHHHHHRHCLLADDGAAPHGRR